MNKNYPKIYKSRRGIALLTTLMVLTLLSIFITEFTFETTLETKSIKNYQASFKSRNAVKSIFKAVLEGIEEQNEIQFFRKYLKGLIEIGNQKYEISFLNPKKPIKLPKGIISDFPEVRFYTPMIRPIDHLYNLNRIQNPPFRAANPETKSDVRLANQFINILKNWYINEKQLVTNNTNKNIQLNNLEALQIYASIFDWLDKDSLSYDSSIYGVIGAEKNFYISHIPKIEIKNGFLDKLSEIKLIGSISEKKIPYNLWEKEFTIYPVGNEYNPRENFSEIKPRINVNLANYEEIINFLENFDQNTIYFTNYSDKNFENIYEMDFFEKREEIARELTKTPRKKLGSEDIKIILSSLTQYESKSNDYFIPFSFWYKINLKTEIDDVEAEIKAIISVDREKESGKVLKVIIHDFLLR